MNDLIDVRETSGGPNLLECLFDHKMVVHLALHLLLQEGRVQPLNQELFLHLDLILILVLVGCHFGDLGLSLDALHPSPECIFLVPDGLLQTLDSLLPLSLVHFDCHHDLVQFHLRLDPILFRCTLFVGLVS